MDSFVNFVDEKIGKDLVLVERELEESHMKMLFNQYKEIALTSIIQQFGLGAVFDLYKKGGNLTTLQNAEKGIFANSDDEKRFQQNYSQELRKNLYEKGFTENRKKTFKNSEKIYDDYTNKELNKDGRTHRDHIISASEIQQNNEARLYMSDKQRGDMATDDKNLAWTNGSLNQSKGEKDFLMWMSQSNTQDKQKTNAEYYGIDEKLARKKYEEARHHINDNVSKAKRAYYIKGIKDTGISQGIAMGQRQAIGLLIYELQDAIFIEMSGYFKEYKNLQGVSEKIQKFKLVCERVTKRVVSNTKKILLAFQEGFINGFIGNLITILINTFTTTAKNMARLLNESIHSLIKAMKLLVNRPKDMSKEDALKEAVKIISTAVITTFGVIMTESFIVYLKTTPLVSFAEIIGGVIGGILTGIVAVTVAYAIDNLAEIVNGIKYYFDGIMLDFTVSAHEMRVAHYEIIETIDAEYELVLKRIYNEYETLHVLSRNAYDLSQTPKELLGSSVKLSQTLDVDEDDILKNETDILAFFNN